MCYLFRVLKYLFLLIQIFYDKLEFQYTVRGEWLNPMGNLHGGVSAAIIDDVIGVTMFSLNEKSFITTINNSIDYFSTAKEGDIIFAQTQVISSTH